MTKTLQSFLAEFKGKTLSVHVTGATEGNELRVTFQTGQDFIDVDILGNESIIAQVYPRN